MNEHVKILAKQRHVTRTPFSGEEPLTEFYPAYPLQYKKNHFKSDNTEERSNKEAPKAPKMTPGLAHIFCRHGICKGFTCMTTAESPEIFTKILTRRFKPNVQCERRVFLYDNACNMHKQALKRDAQEILKFKLFTDRHHWSNHTGCSEGYECDKYDYLKSVNLQICEQKNRSLRKLSSTLAYSQFYHYITKLKLFFFLQNLEEKSLW